MTGATCDGRGSTTVTDQRTVARTLTPVLGLFGVLALLSVVVGVTGVALSTSSLQTLTEEVQPAALANELTPAGPDRRRDGRTWVRAQR